MADGLFVSDNPGNDAGTGTPGGDPRDSMTNPLLNGAGGEQQPQAQPNGQLESQIPDKFRGQNGELNTDGLLKSYQFAEKKIAEQGQQLTQFQDVQRQLQEMRGLLEQQNQPPQQEITSEQIAQMNEEWRDSFYEDPMAAVTGLVNNIVSPIVQPIAQQREYEQQVNHWNQQLQLTAQANPDFHDLLPAMQEIVSQQGEALTSLPNAVEVVYSMAKARQAKSPDQLMQDQGFRQRIMQDESIRQEIIKSYGTQIRQNQPPVVIGGQPAGQPPATPPNEIKSTSEAKRAAMGYFSRILGGGQ